MTLTRYWIRFDRPVAEPAALLAPGFGVTAYTLDDALRLLRIRVFGDRPVPPIRDVIEDVDVASLDPGHVLPNMLPPNWRGIWFPLGYGPEPLRRS